MFEIHVVHLQWEWVRPRYLQSSVADRKLLCREIGNVCSQTRDVLCTMSSSTADKHLRVRIGGPNCNYLFLHISTTFMIHWSF